MKYLYAKKQFYDYIKSYAAEDTIKYYEWCLYSFEQFLIEYYVDYRLEFDVNSIDTILLNTYIVYKRDKIKNVSIRTYYRGIKAFLNFCNNYLECNIPLKQVKLPKNDNKLKLPLTRIEYDKLIRACSGDMVERNTLIVMMMCQCGLRLQEILFLRKDNVNIDECMLIIEFSKNNKSRIVPMNMDLAKRLNCYMNSHNSKYVFVQDNGEPITEYCIHNLFNKKLKKAIPRVHPHLLRHTFATSYIMGGGSLEYLRCILGHTSYNVTQQYISMATELAINKYDIYRLDKGLFNTFTY